MHSKQKGNIAEAAVILRLSELGYNVFKEIGDLSKIDILAEKDGEIIRIQVKGVTPITNNSVLPLSLKKSGPNYSFKYKQEMFDYFAVVNLDTKEVCFVPSSILQTNKACLYIRLNQPKKTGGSHKFKFFSDYLLLENKRTSETTRETPEMAMI